MVAVVLYIDAPAVPCCPLLSPAAPCCAGFPLEISIPRNRNKVTQWLPLLLLLLLLLLKQMLLLLLLKQML